MTDDREPIEKVRDELKALSSVEICSPSSYTMELEGKVRAITARLAAAEAHEQQTHERLGAILGTDTSLEDAAKRMAERLAAVEAENERLTRWRDLAVAAATAGAEQEVFKRFAESEAIQPIIQAWKDKVASLEQRLAAAEAALREILDRAEDDDVVSCIAIASKAIGLRMFVGNSPNSESEAKGGRDE